jgi:hypothetical protein
MPGDGSWSKETESTAWGKWRAKPAARVDRLLADPLAALQALLAGPRVGEDVEEGAQVDADVAARHALLLAGDALGQRLLGVPRGARVVADKAPGVRVVLAVDEDVALGSQLGVPPDLPVADERDAAPQQGGAQLALEAVGLPGVVEGHLGVAGALDVLVGLRLRHAHELRARLGHLGQLGAHERLDPVVDHRLAPGVDLDVEQARGVPAHPLAALQEGDVHVGVGLEAPAHRRRRGDVIVELADVHLALVAELHRADRG